MARNAAAQTTPKSAAYSSAVLNIDDIPVRNGPPVFLENSSACSPPPQHLSSSGNSRHGEANRKFAFLKRGSRKEPTALNRMIKQGKMTRVAPAAASNMQQQQQQQQHKGHDSAVAAYAAVVGGTDDIRDFADAAPPPSSDPKPRGQSSGCRAIEKRQKSHEKKQHFQQYHERQRKQQQEQEEDHQRQQEDTIVEVHVDGNSPSFDEGGLLSSQKQHQPQVISWQPSRQQSAAAMDAVRGFEELEDVLREANSDNYGSENEERSHSVVGNDSTAGSGSANTAAGEQGFEMKEQHEDVTGVSVPAAAVEVQELDARGFYEHRQHTKIRHQRNHHNDDVILKENFNTNDDDGGGGGGDNDDGKDVHSHDQKPNCGGSGPSSAEVADTITDVAAAAANIIACPKRSFSEHAANDVDFFLEKDFQCDAFLREENHHHQQHQQRKYSGGRSYGEAEGGCGIQNRSSRCFDQGANCVVEDISSGVSGDEVDDNFDAFEPHECSQAAFDTKVASFRCKGEAGRGQQRRESNIPALPAEVDGDLCEIGEGDDEGRKLHGTDQYQSKRTFRNDGNNDVDVDGRRQNGATSDRLPQSDLVRRVFMGGAQGEDEGDKRRSIWKGGRGRGRGGRSFVGRQSNSRHHGWHQQPSIAGLDKEQQGFVAELTAAAEEAENAATARAEILAVEVAAAKQQRRKIKEVKQQQDALLRDALKKRDEVKKWSEDERAAVKAWCKQQKVLVERDRQNAQRKAEALVDGTAPSTRAERAEIEALRATVAKLELDKQQQAKAARASEGRLRQKLRLAHDQVRELQDQCHLLESRHAMWLQQPRGNDGGVRCSAGSTGVAGAETVQGRGANRNGGIGTKAQQQRQQKLWRQRNQAQPSLMPKRSNTQMRPLQHEDSNADGCGSVDDTDDAGEFDGTGDYFDLYAQANDEQTAYDNGGRRRKAEANSEYGGDYDEEWHQNKTTQRGGVIDDFVAGVANNGGKDGSDNEEMVDNKGRVAAVAAGADTRRVFDEKGSIFKMPIALHSSGGNTQCNRGSGIEQRHRRNGVESGITTYSGDRGGVENYEKVEQQYMDGTAVTWYANGTKKQKFLDGNMVVSFRNGDVKKTLPCGIVTYFYASAKVRRLFSHAPT
jgi:hypothetical protein